VRWVGLIIKKDGHIEQFARRASKAVYTRKEYCWMGEADEACGTDQRGEQVLASRGK
jgi:hypothetical protein